MEPRTDRDFLKRIEENCADVPDNAVKLGVIRNKVLDKMRSPSISGSMCSRSSSKTRPRSKGEELSS